MAKLRFAPLIRVSTERQERQGESLNTQRKQIIAYVKALNGTIPKRCWRYSGQEHGTQGFEREKLDELLQDATKNMFDAVIVADASRWSRDNLKSEQGLEILKQNGIRFFSGQTEYDLYNPEQKFSLALFTNINEMVAMQNALKSMQNKIALAKQNIPSSGRLPYGRTFNRSTNKWGLDVDKKAKIEDAAQKYLSGVSMNQLAEELEVSNPTVWAILNKRSGDKYQISFKSERLNIDETVDIKIPALLPEKTIKAIKQRAAANKTFTHGQAKNKYLLGRMIFCGKCGQALSGFPSVHRYYRHMKNGCDHFSNIRCDQIETDIFWNIYWMIGDRTGFEQAVKDAVPDTKGIDKANNRLNQILFDLKRINNEKQRLVKAVMKATLDDETVKTEMDKLKSRETDLSDEKQTLSATIEKQPSKNDIDNRFKGWERLLKSNYELNEDHILKMPFNEKRALLQSVFSGKDENGKRYGVYITKTRDKDHPWQWEIRGNLPAINDSSHIGSDPIGPTDTDAERQSLETTYEKLFKQNSVYPCKLNHKKLGAAIFLLSGGV